MKINRRQPPNPDYGKSFFCMVLLSITLFALPAGSTQVKVLTPSGGSGQTSSTTHQVRLTTGQAIIGKTIPASGQTAVELGIWAMLSRTYIASPVGDETPNLRNQLFGNYPNPFNPSTRISFNLVRQAEVRIDVYDLQGRRVDTLLQAVKPAGTHSLTYQPQGLASGVYLVLMRADDFRATQRIMLVK